MKICDFGLTTYSISGTATSFSVMSIGAQACTRQYASPERLRGGRRSYRDDLYAFGMLLFFLATSREPFNDLDADSQVAAVKADQRPDLSEWVWRQSGGEWQRAAIEFAALAQRCWHPDPRSRPEGGFEEVYSELSRMLWPPMTPPPLE